ncbi:MAG: NTP transferase domain-containing protein [Chloroflexi bacterium]|nr:NTP transferase domain-containing protein [Chloroflexota bacterium]
MVRPAFDPDAWFHGTPEPLAGLQEAKMKAIVMAGGTPSPDDPLYPYTQGRPKALLDIAGKPMLQWVLDALNASQAVDGLLVYGVNPQMYPWRVTKPVTWRSDRGSMVKNILAGLEELSHDEPEDAWVLLVSGDVPTITGEILDWAAENVRHFPTVDVVYHVVERRVMEQRFPGVRRTYLRLRDVEVCGGDVNLARVRVGKRDDDLWDRLYAARKSPLRQAALVGWGTLLKILLRRLTLAEAVAEVSQRLRLPGIAVLSPYAELAMDVDKPEHVEIVRRELSQRQGEDTSV